MSTQLKQEFVTQVAYTVPPVGVWLGFWEKLAGVTLDHWVGYSSILYCVLQSIYLIYKWRKEIKSTPKSKDDD